METQSKPKTSVSEFGAELYALIYARGMRSLVDLSKQMEEVGVGVTRQSLSAYANGTRRVPPSLCRKIDAALNLTQQERARLGIAVAFGQPDEDTRATARTA